MLLRLAPGVLKTRPDGLKQFRTLTGASPRIIENRLQCELRKYDPMSDVQSRVEIVGYLLVSSVTACALQVTFLVDFFVGFLDFAKSLCSKFRKFFGKTFGHNHVRMKILDELLITRFDFLI